MTITSCSSYLFSGCRHWGQPVCTLPSQMALDFCFRKEGRCWHGQSAQALASLLPTGSSLSSVAMILETTCVYIIPDPHPTCPLRMCPSNPAVPGEGAGATTLPLRRHNSRGLSFQWQPSAAHLPIRGMDQTALGCCEVGRAQRLGTPLLAFCTIPLFRVFVLA